MCYISIIEYCSAIRKEGNILFSAPEGLKQRQTTTWTWLWEIIRPHMHWVALVASWGQGVERNLQIVPWVIGTWPSILKVTYPGPADCEMLLHDTFVIFLWVFFGWAHYEFSTVIASKCWAPIWGMEVMAFMPGKAPSASHCLFGWPELACIFPEGHDLPSLVPITALSFHS